MNAEEELRKLAAGPGWDDPMVRGRDRDAAEYATQIAKTIGDVQANWTSLASSAAQEHLAALVHTLSNASEWLVGLHRTIKSTDADVQSMAARELEDLPPGNAPQRVLDAIHRGDPSVITDLGLVALTGIAAPIAIGMLNSKYAKERERAAALALNRVEVSVTDSGQNYMKKVEVGFDIVKPSSTAVSSTPSASSWPGGVMGTGVGVGVGVGIAGGAVGAGSRVPLPQGGGSGPGGAGRTPGSIPPGSKPGDPNDRPGTGGPGTGGPGDGGGGGNNPGGGDGGYGPGDRYPTPQRPAGPAVDGGLDSGQTGLGMRSGLGAAGLGAAGLAAGAKLASGAGAGGLGAGAGGLGAGGFGVGGPGGAGTAGLGGTTGTGSAGAGAGNSGSNAAKGAGAGAGRQGMMMGGQGGGAADKKGGANRLGYVAPKFEDDYEESMPHPASRAGKRGE